jgi:ABC-type transport system involved in cytochrome bd biosynthesis fused ATPase/permease subunit
MISHTACQSIWTVGTPSYRLGAPLLSSSRQTGGFVAQVTFDRVRKVYPDGTLAVKELSLEIADGELVVFVGPSGCGKTTALRMVAGLEEISDGEIRIGDEGGI